MVGILVSYVTLCCLIWYFLQRNRLQASKPPRVHLLNTVLVLTKSFQSLCLRFYLNILVRQCVLILSLTYPFRYPLLIIFKASLNMIEFEREELNTYTFW